MADEPREQRRGWLKNGNPPGDLSRAPRCGARTRRATACRAPAMRNGRCRLHGGASTGPKTPEGLERSRRARWIHGFYSAGAKARRASARQKFLELRDALRAINPTLIMRYTQHRPGGGRRMATVNDDVAVALESGARILAEPFGG